MSNQRKLTPEDYALAARLLHAAVSVIEVAEPLYIDRHVRRISEIADALGTMASPYPEAPLADIPVIKQEHQPFELDVSKADWTAPPGLFVPDHTRPLAVMVFNGATLVDIVTTDESWSRNADWVAYDVTVRGNGREYTPLDPREEHSRRPDLWSILRAVERARARRSRP